MSQRRQPRRGSGGLRPDLRRLLRAAEAPDASASAAAAPVDRHRLCRLAVRAAAAELLFARRFLRPHRPRVHARRPTRSCFEEANLQIILRTVIDGGARHHRLRRHRLSHRLLCGALCPRLDQGAVLSRGDDAAMVELSRQGLCLEAHPRQGRHPDLDRRTGCICRWLLDGILPLPVIGGPSLSFSYIGTFLVFVYIWLPYMILPIAGGA